MPAVPFSGAAAEFSLPAIPGRLLRTIDAIIATACMEANLPLLDERSTEEILGYGDDGLCA